MQPSRCRRLRAGRRFPRTEGWATHDPPRSPGGGTTSSSVGRTRRNPATAALPFASAAATSLSHGAGAGGSGKPSTSPSATAEASTVQSRWTSRLASGAARSHPSAACSGGFAAATMRTSEGKARSPTDLSRTMRSIAAWTAGGLVVSSSRKSRPLPAFANRTAQAGGDSTTPPSVTTGRPAKSLGSRMEPMTTSTFIPLAAPSASTTEVLPVPGAPHSSTGTLATTATASARPATPLSTPDHLNCPIMTILRARAKGKGEGFTRRIVVERLSATQRVLAGWSG